MKTFKVSLKIDDVEVLAKNEVDALDKFIAGTLRRLTSESILPYVNVVRRVSATDKLVELISEEAVSKIIRCRDSASQDELASIIVEAADEISRHRATEIARPTGMIELKSLTCKHCRADLSKGGVYTVLSAELTDYSVDKDGNLTQGKTDSGDIDVRCRKCGEIIDCDVTTFTDKGRLSI